MSSEEDQLHSLPGQYNANMVTDDSDSIGDGEASINTSFKAATPQKPVQIKSSTSQLLSPGPMESDDRLPEGWYRKVVQRKDGASAGKYDVYIYSPVNKKFRSRQELARYVEHHKLDLNIEEFDFSVRGIHDSNQSPKKGKVKSKVSSPIKKKTETKFTIKSNEKKTETKITKVKKKKDIKIKKSTEQTSSSKKLIVKMKFPVAGKKRKNGDMSDSDEIPKKKNTNFTATNDDDISQESSMGSDDEMENTQPVLSKKKMPTKRPKSRKSNGEKSNFDSCSPVRKRDASFSSPKSPKAGTKHRDGVSTPPRSPDPSALPSPRSSKGSTPLRRSLSLASAGNVKVTPRMTRPTYRRGSAQLLAGL